MLAVKLPHLPAWNEARRQAATRYDELLGRVPGVTPIAVRDDVVPVYHLYVVLVDDRDAVRAKLGEAGVDSGIHYPAPLHLQPAYAGLGYGPGDFPVAEAMAPRLLSLPMYPELTAGQQDYVVEKLAGATAGGSAA